MGCEACGIGVTGFGPSNPCCPCNCGDVAWLKTMWEAGPFVLVGSHCSVQPPCRIIFGACVFPTLMIILVQCNPNCIYPSEEVIKVEMLAVHEGCNQNEWVRELCWNCQ